ncbi:MAG: hypothetical protein MUO99_01350 [Dehalococcoidales bacterium]|nr:hypothetical protein [Dehalococcoidales bacterium]
MHRDELNKKVNDELKHIPRGSFDQNMLREYYNGMRRHDLSLTPVVPAKDTLIRAIEAVRKDKPDFLAMYDREFFKT